MSQDPVLYDLDEGIARMTLNNPRQRNVLSTRTLELLNRYLTQAGEDPEARVIVIRSTGPVFSSGHDLNELVGHDRESYSGVFADCTRVMELVRLLPKPVIAQVQGLATAAGCQLVATCDLAVAAETSAFATPGVQIGLFCTTPGVAVGRAVMPKKAMEMLLTGTPIPAAEALEFGLINRVVPAERLEEEVTDLARRIASASSVTLAIGKPAFYRQMDLDRPAAYEMAQKVMVDNLMEEDAHEGITAFLEKREPRWKN